ncbi:hypothetical protein GA0115254_12139 [Streptomyces sp. Ncost-T10-10d]|nr:hypothetical protein GA0115254_12139 [Streptomyces sp. Ncost-T10-10d]
MTLLQSPLRVDLNGQVRVSPVAWQTLPPELTRARCGRPWSTAPQRDADVYGAGASFPASSVRTGKRRGATKTSTSRASAAAPAAPR